MVMHVKEQSRQEEAAATVLPTTVDYTDASALGAALAGQTKSTTNLLSVTEEQIGEIDESSSSLASILDILEQQTMQSQTNVDRAHVNKNKIAMNPFSEIVGLFNPDYNVKVQNNNLAAEGQTQQNIGRTGQRAIRQHEFTIADADRQVSLASSEFAAATSQVSTFSKGIALKMQQSQIKQAEQMTIARDIPGSRLAELEKKLQSAPSGTIIDGVTLSDVLDVKGERAAITASINLANKPRKGTGAEDIYKDMLASVNMMPEPVVRKALTLAQQSADGNATLTGYGAFKFPKDMLETRLSEIATSGSKQGKAVAGITVEDLEQASVLDTLDTSLTRMIMHAGNPATFRDQVKPSAEAGPPEDYKNNSLREVMYLNGNPLPGTGLDPSELPENLRSSLGAYLMASQTASRDQTSANFDILIAAGVSLDKKIKVEQTAIIDAADKESRAGMREWFSTGKISNAVNAGPVVYNTVTGAGADLTDTTWLGVTNAIREEIDARGATPNLLAEGADVSTFLGLSLGRKKQTKADLMVQISRAPGVQQARAAMISNLSEDLLKAAVKDLSGTNQFFVNTLMDRNLYSGEDLSVNMLVDKLNGLDDKARTAGAIGQDESLAEILTNRMRETMGPYVKQRLSANTKAEAGLMQLMFANEPRGLMAAFVGQIERTTKSRRGN